jgi:hypothetical protein
MIKPMDRKTRLDADTVLNALSSIKRMICLSFFEEDDTVLDGLPLKGSEFLMSSDTSHRIRIHGHVDAAAADLYRTESSYFSFCPNVNGKKKFFKMVVFQEDAPRLEKELNTLFRLQRAHNVAWALWSD